MTDIDWSKAPDWANMHGFASYEAIGVWLNKWQYVYADGRQGGRVFSFVGREGWAIDQISCITTRQKSEWTGEGLPHAGDNIEIHKGPASWDSQKEWLGLQARVVHVFKNQLDQDIVAVEAGSGECACFIAECLRPIRTPWQIAAEERGNEVNRILDAMPPDVISGHTGAIVEWLLMNGYRKFEIIDE